MEMTSLQGKTIILGVTGSIAAIKSPALAEQLRANGANVRCVVTGSAMQFATVDELSKASGNIVVKNIFESQKPKTHEEWTWHVHLGRSADAMLIAPCSASTLGVLRAGIYDNPVTLVAASLPKGTPLIIVPAMDEDMWLQPAVQENLKWLKTHGVRVIEPVEGKLASGLIGLGRMPEPADIISRLNNLLTSNKQLAGKRILITGGPTYEPIDAVRFIGNRSSGKMAVALANAAKNMGAEVTLIMGPTTMDTNGLAARIDVETAEQMLNAVTRELPEQDIIIMSAAVADFTPATVSEGKLKKREVADASGNISIPLQRTPDILAEIARIKTNNQVVVGFALEKGPQSEQYAHDKLKEKNLDMIVLNDIAEAGAGFGHDTNKVTIFTKNGSKESLPLLSKEECAREILNRIITIA
jgi:phosphopantothenoylcysteine decarboxylase/phosphopantothenate--cysteine ligase